MINLGDKVKDTITDFEGTAVARCVYLNGCVRIEVQPKELKDGKMINISDLPIFLFFSLFFILTKKRS